jgi:hypothetical protein
VTVARTAKIMDIRDAFIAGLEGIGGRTLGVPDCLHFNFAIELSGTLERRLASCDIPALV